MRLDDRLSTRKVPAMGSNSCRGNCVVLVKLKSKRCRLLRPDRVPRGMLPAPGTPESSRLTKPGQATNAPAGRLVMPLFPLSTSSRSWDRLLGDGGSGQAIRPARPSKSVRSCVSCAMPSRGRLLIWFEERSNLDSPKADSQTSAGTDCRPMPLRMSSALGRLVFPTVGWGGGSGGVASVAKGAVLCAALKPEAAVSGGAGCCEGA
mmetsp:Transcript_7320/g.19590  ORF Transcript_7320/g.19590 Transcript_7320/m.19590 type:complete len:206 (+) Transcript_7320:664-1281(+)